MDFVKILEFLEKHFSWRYVVMVLIAIAAFAMGYYFCSAQRDKQEAILVNEHTKNIKEYSDSAQSAKINAIEAEMEYRFTIISKDKTIDSLKSVIKSYENGQDKK